MKLRTSLIGLVILITTGTATAQESDVADGANAMRIDLLTLIERIAEDSNQDFIIDPRVGGLNVFATSNDLDYDNLLSILRVHGLIALAKDDAILIVPEANARSEATRLLQEDDARVSDHEIVTRIIEIPAFPDTRSAEQIAAQLAENPFAGGASSAAQLVPVLRPMMPQSAQLGAIPGTNKLIIVDRYDNVRRITAVIEEIVDGLGN